MTASRGHLLTEQNNPNSINLDQLSSLEIVELFNREDAQPLTAINNARHQLAKAIDLTSEALKQGGRLFYVGAGTSGRLGVLDAAECPPTFCTSPELVQGIIAGGETALVQSSEGLEDRSEDGESAIAQYGINAQDVVVGITAGGTTPYVHGALNAAQQQGAKTVFLACVSDQEVSVKVDVDIRLLVGAEVLAGSTRLKAGTATKMALNILSTGIMVNLGKVYGNRMVDVAVTNEKLRDRALRILQDLTPLSQEEASRLLEQSGNRVKTALLMQWEGLTREQAEHQLTNHGQSLSLHLSSS